MKILGIDPGSRFAGFGCIELKGNQLRHVASGTLTLASGSGAGGFELRLLRLFEELEKLIQEHSPTVLSVEKVFFAKNALSALKLGQARGVVLLAGARHSLEITEYSPTEIKQALTGHGRADKDHVRKMVEIICGKRSFPSHDASDALAVAICHSRFALSGSSSTAAGAWVGAAKKGRRRAKPLSELLAPVIRSRLGRDC